jgi:multidrug transporter EmrE-like cation transporter
MIFAFLLMIIAIILTGVGQVVLKIGSGNNQNQNLLDPYLNPASLTGYGLYLISTVFLLYSLREIPLKLFAAVSSLNFIIVLFLTGLLLKESITKQKILAVMLIVAGVIIFNVP